MPKLECNEDYRELVEKLTVHMEQALEAADTMPILIGYTARVDLRTGRTAITGKYERTLYIPARRTTDNK